jgi:hypothetical protein
MTARRRKPKAAAHSPDHGRRDKITAIFMRRLSAHLGLPFFKRFRRGRPDRGRSSAR